MTPDDLGDPLEQGLRAAYGPAAPESVLSRLAPGRPLRPGVLLRDEGSSPEHILTLRSAEAARTSEGRYQIVGELARGGVGVVLKGRDADLGRDVAMKVLREEHAESAEVLDRFVEEAQIGGQLQHPGIVPVYELGVRADRRPYFTMKLIKGRTLAAILAERRDPSEDLRRLLAIFESVCQTVAYAHSRGVIHRDLKPANVMVGAFGEVLVVDWGMGKVLSRDGPSGGAKPGGAGGPERTRVATLRSGGSGSHSEVGSVMGTPRYMPPEQARGEIESLDERADVFSLGAILCEILSGRPPYASGDVDVLGQAARGALDDAHARLDGSGADGELVALAKACLAPAPAARPKDALAVAKEIGAYLASVEERVRDAELATAAARVKAAEERKRRRLSLALAAAVLGLVTLGGGGWLMVERGRRERAGALAREVGHAIEEATLLRGRAASGTDVGPWAEAVSAAKRAVAIAGSPGADETTRAEAARLLAALEADERAAAEAVRRKERDEAMVARLDDIRLDRSEQWDIATTVGQYAQAFRDHGIDPEGTENVSALVANVRESAIASALILALEEWRRLAAFARRPSERLEALVAAVDVDPWRARLRTAKTLDQYRDLARTVDLDRMPKEALVLLVDGLGFSGAPAEAADLARAVQARHPGDFYANSVAGDWALESRPQRVNDAVRFCSAARALRPGSWAVRSNLGNAFREQGDLHGAVAQYREAIRLAPADAVAHNNLGSALIELGELDAAMIELREALRLRPGYSAPHVNIGNVLSLRGDILGAIAEFREAIRLRPNNWYAHSNLGNELVKSRDLVGAIAEYREATRLWPNHALGHVVLSAALFQNGDIPGAIAAAREALRLDKDLVAGHVTLSEALRVSGELDAAIVEAREALRLDATYAEAHAALGLALQLKGALDGALSSLREAARLKPDSAAAHRNLGLLLNRRGEFDAAILELRRAIEIQPQDADAHDGLGHALYFKGEFDAAIAEIRESIRLKPGSSVAHGHLGLALRDKGDLVGAERAHREAVRLAPRNPFERVNLGIVLARRGDHEGAMAQYREAIRLNPNVPQAHNNLGNELREFLGDSKGALAEYREAVRLDPTTWFHHNGVGLALDDLGDLPGAMAAFRDAIRVDPRQAVPRVRLGIALNESGDPEAAVACFEDAIRVAPGDPDGHYHLSFALRRVGRFADTVAAYRRAMELGAKSPGWQKTSPEALKRLEKFAAAAPTLDDVVAGRLKPKDADEWAAYAKVAYYIGRYAVAVRLYRESFAKKPEIAYDFNLSRNYDAACAAVLGSCGKGKDGALSASERSRLRKQAHEWLRAELDRTPRGLAEKPKVRKALTHWSWDPDLAGVRGEDVIAQLPAGEQEMWRSLWRDVDTLLAQSKEDK